MIKKQTWMAILATVVLLAGVGCGDSPEEIDPDESGIDAREGCKQVWTQFAQQLFEFFFDAHS